MMQILQVCISHLRNLWHYSALFFFFFSKRRGMLHNRPERGRRNKAFTGNPAHRAQNIAAGTPRHAPQFFRATCMQKQKPAETQSVSEREGKRNQTGYVSSGSDPAAFSLSSLSESSACRAELLVLLQWVSLLPTCELMRTVYTYLKNTYKPLLARVAWQHTQIRLVKI